MPAQFVEHFNGDGRFGAEILRALCPANLPFAGLGCDASAGRGASRKLRLCRARYSATRPWLTTMRPDYGTARTPPASSITDETRDLLLRQLAATPLFIKTLCRQWERNLALDTYVACEQLYC